MKFSKSKGSLVIKFAALYALSIVLILVIVLSTVKDTSGSSDQPNVLTDLERQELTTLRSNLAVQRHMVAPPDSSEISEAPRQTRAKTVTSGQDGERVQLLKELEEKNRIIATLKSRMSSPQISNEDGGDRVYAPAKGNTIEDLRQRNTNLSLGFKSLQNKIWNMMREYSAVVRDNEALKEKLKQLQKQAPVNSGK